MCKAVYKMAFIFFRYCMESPGAEVLKLSTIRPVLDLFLIFGDHDILIIWLNDKIIYDERVYLFWIFLDHCTDTLIVFLAYNVYILVYLLHILVTLTINFVCFFMNCISFLFTRPTKNIISRLTVWKSLT